MSWSRRSVLFFNIHLDFILVRWDWLHRPGEALLTDIWLFFSSARLPLHHVCPMLDPVALRTFAFNILWHAEAPMELSPLGTYLRVGKGKKMESKQASPLEVFPPRVGPAPRHSQLMYETITRPQILAWALSHRPQTDQTKVWTLPQVMACLAGRLLE